MVGTPSKVYQPGPAVAKGRRSPIKKRRRAIVGAARTRAADAAKKRPASSPLGKEMRAAQREMEKTVIDQAAKAVLTAQGKSTTAGGLAAFGSVREIMDRFTTTYDFCTKDKVYHAVRALKAKGELEMRIAAQAAKWGERAATTNTARVVAFDHTCLQ